MLHSEDNKFFRQTGRRGGGGGAASPGGEKSKGSLRERGARGGGPWPARRGDGGGHKSLCGQGAACRRRREPVSEGPWAEFSSLAPLLLLEPRRGQRRLRRGHRELSGE